VAALRPDAGVLEGRDRKSGELKWTGSVVDLAFGSNAHLRGFAEVYAAGDAGESSCATSWPPGTR
jgi:catalase-peroxidase